MRILHKKLCLLMFLLTGCSLGIFAQNRTITGTVRDAVDVVIGASVTVKGNSSIGTITDMDGKFRISVPSSARDLVIKFIGYDDAVIRLGTPTDYKVTLKESSVMLEEVVAIGYAKVKRKDLTGAISSVGGKELANVPVTTAMQALQGKAAGGWVQGSHGHGEFHQGSLSVYPSGRTGRPDLRASGEGYPKLPSEGLPDGCRIHPDVIHDHVLRQCMRN